MASAREYLQSIQAALVKITGMSDSELELQVRQLQEMDDLAHDLLEEWDNYDGPDESPTDVESVQERNERLMKEPR